ncbi:MAG: GNAT family N-acetyltransferase [Alphaproteobacteria bacterium]|nr:GNAT family N-acetyltransferase [Alphaproteobacteria bacterium]
MSVWAIGPAGAEAAPLLGPLHRAAFAAGGFQQWADATLAGLLAAPLTLALGAADAADAAAGFILGRLVAGEAEIVTLAVAPGRQGGGIGGALVGAFLEAARAAGATRAVLEVAEDNAPARAVYARHGFRQAGRRLGYYARAGGGRIDALLLAIDLAA